MSDDDMIMALRRLGPDVGEPADAQSVPYVDPDLEHEVMLAILRYPGSSIDKDGKVHGLAAVAAITTVEKWLRAAQVRQSRPQGPL